MIDKEKIEIDGVDVSGCKHYKINGKCRIPHYQQGIKYINCNCNEWDCYFKQLTLKTQECEELKRKVELMMDCPDCKVDEYKKALEEIEKLISDDEFAKCPIDGENCNYFTSRKILDIINKAKGAEDER